MTEKRYVFIPETTKVVSVFNAGNETVKNYVNFSDCKPEVSFRYAIDEFDKTKLFYLAGKENPYATDDESYFNAKAKDAIRAIFNVQELAEFTLFLNDDNPRVEFTIFFDINGNECSKYKLDDLIRSRTILAHSYVFNIYKRFNLQ